GLEKLRRWSLYVHGGIDGYSRTAVYLICAPNKTAATVFDGFWKSTKQYGIPSRVRSDYGKENVDVAAFMIATRGDHRGSFIAGKSVHNQRIERLHQDTYRNCIQHFHKLFYQMEQDGILNPSNAADIFCLHYVFLPRINEALQIFREGWNEHPLSTESSNTPKQLWMKSVLAIENANNTAIKDILDPQLVDYSMYGIEPTSDELLSCQSDENEDLEIKDMLGNKLILSDHNMQILCENINPLGLTSDYGVDLYLTTCRLVSSLV
ncbi:uncharacterized protein LOC102805259, partial [Saccoglossus kowalevskii]